MTDLVLEAVSSDMEHLPCNIIYNNRAACCGIYIARRAIGWIYIVLCGKLLPFFYRFGYLIVCPPALCHLALPFCGGFVASERPARCAGQFDRSYPERFSNGVKNFNVSERSEWAGGP